MQAINDTTGEHLSSFLDGELPQEQFALLLRRLDRDIDLRAALARYAAIGECLRDEPDQLSTGFNVRVCEAIAQEAGDAAGRRTAAGHGIARERGIRRAGKLVAGLALAATVAGVAILALQTRQSSLDGPEGQRLAGVDTGLPGTILIGNSMGDESDSYTVPAPATTSPLVPGARLTDYVFAHSEYSSLLGRRNVLSSVIAEDPTPVDSTEQDADLEDRP